MICVEYTIHIFNQLLCFDYDVGIAVREMWEDDLKIVEFAPPEGGKKVGDGARTQEIFLDFIMTHAHLQSNASSYLFNDNFNGMKSPGEKELQEKLIEVCCVLRFRSLHFMDFLPDNIFSIFS